MGFQLSLNLGFAVTRFPYVRDWAPICLDAGISNVQFVASLIDSRVGPHWTMKQAELTRSEADRYGIRIQSTFTDAYTRLSHLSSPDPEVRKFWTEWFRTFSTVTAVLGGEAMGSHLGALSIGQDSSQVERNDAYLRTIDLWGDISIYAKTQGLKYLMWEPMSVSREFGETIEKAVRIDQDLSEVCALPVFMCLDVDHGDPTSSSPDDSNPYSWLERLGDRSPVVHLKQSKTDKSGHFPFTDVHNAEGQIRPAAVVDALKRAGRTDGFLTFEFSFRERDPADASAKAAVLESAKFWQREIDVE